MLKYLYILSILCGPLTSQSQRVVDVNNDQVNVVALLTVVGKEQVSSAKYVKVVSGTPYFNEKWMRGAIMLKDSSEVANLLLRLDLLANKVEYVSKSGEQLIVTAPIWKIRLTDSITGEHSYFIHSSAIPVSNVALGWYQILSQGKVGLYKKINKDIQENKPYGSATYEQTINTSSQYYLYNGTSFTHIQKFKELPGVLADKQTELTRMIKEKGLNGKKDEDYISLITWYNQ